MIDKVSKLALAVACLAAPSTALAEQTRSNILLIIADDVGLDTTTGMYPGLTERLLEEYGPQGRNHPDYRRIDGHPASTPNLDRLAQDSMVFTQAWAHPFCSPTRASILTGLFAKGTRVRTYADPLSQNHDSFVTRLRDEGGYGTAVFGKWHMAGVPGRDGNGGYTGMKPKEAGFDLFKGNLHAALPTYWQYDVQVQDEATPPGEWRSSPAEERSLPGIAPTTYAAVAKGADTIDWIRQQESGDPDKPWFAWMAFNLAHATAIQQPSAMMVPNADTLDETSRAEMEACGGTFGTNEVGDCTGEALNRAMTNSMDTVIGKVLAAVDALDPNTYVIFVSDNGTPMYGRPGLDFIDNMYITREDRGKGSAYESGARVALAVRGPGIAPGSASAEFVHAADLYATVLELAGLAPPETVPDATGTGRLKLDAVSLKPILTGAAAHVRDPEEGYILTESANLMRGGTTVVGARNATYKLVCTQQADDCQFFDLAADPLEEYPLEEPASCPVAGSASMPRGRERQYCHLREVVAQHSILSSDA